MIFFITFEPSWGPDPFSLKIRTLFRCKYTLKKGRFVSLSGRLRVNTNVKDDKTYVNLDVWVSNIDLAPAGKD